MRPCSRVRYILVAAVMAFTATPASARVIVLGVDGASWDAIDPMLAAGELPNLAALIERGGSAELDTVEPLTSPVVWTSIATGRSPAAHGITDFFSTRTQIRVPTIYERLAAAGVRVGLYEVLMTWPPAALPGGFVVPGWLRRDDATWPVDAAEAGGPEAPGLFRTNYDPAPDRAYLEQAHRELATKIASWQSLAQRFDPEVGALTFYAVDSLSHRYWHGLEPTAFDAESTRELEPDEASAVRDAVLGIDRAIGELVATLAPEDSLIVVSDHGFQADPDGRAIWSLRLDDALARAGLDPERDGFRVVSTFFAVTIRIAPGPTAERDALIERLRRMLESFTTLEGDALLFVSAIDVGDRPIGSERPLLDRVRQWATRTAARWMFEVVPDPTAQAMIFGLPRGGRLESLWPQGEVRVAGEIRRVAEVVERSRFTGTHHPTAVFAAAGGPLARQSARGRLSVLDVAPLVSYLADRPIPDDLDGTLPLDWIEREHRSAHPPRAISADAMPGLADDPSAARPVHDPELVEKLRALGYIE